MLGVGMRDEGAWVPGGSSRTTGWAAVHYTCKYCRGPQVRVLLFQSDHLCTLPCGAGLIATTSAGLDFSENV